MIGLPSGRPGWLAVGRTDMRKGFGGLAAAVPDRLAQGPFWGEAAEVFAMLPGRGCDSMCAC